jgi:hypothetical protein
LEKVLKCGIWYRVLSSSFDLQCHLNLKFICRSFLLSACPVVRVGY